MILFENHWGFRSDILLLIHLAQGCQIHVKNYLCSIWILHVHCLVSLVVAHRWGVQACRRVPPTVLIELLLKPYDRAHCLIIWFPFILFPNLLALFIQIYCLVQVTIDRFHLIEEMTAAIILYCLYDLGPFHQIILYLLLFLAFRLLHQSSLLIFLYLNDLWSLISADLRFMSMANRLARLLNIHLFVTEIHP